MKRMATVWGSLALALSAFVLLVPASAAACPNEQFRVGPAANLPDCRAYERSSPAEKNGGAVEGFPNYLTASSDGSSVTYFTQAGTGIPASGGAPSDFSTYISSKVGEAWSTQRLMPPQSADEKAHYLGATRNQHYAFGEVIQSAAGPTAGRGLFVIDTQTQSVEIIVPTTDNPEPGFGGPEYAVDGASADGSRVIFETRAQLASGATPTGTNIYLWSRSSDQITLAGVLPGQSSQAPPSGSFGGAYEWYLNESLYVGGALWGLGVEALNAINSDASQIYFTAAETGQLYLRRGLDGPRPETVLVSRPDAGVNDPNGEKPAAFQEATSSGRFVFFLSAARLTSDATTGTSDEGRDLYRWDSATDSLIDIAPDNADELGAQVQGLLGVGESGDIGYFVAKGAVAPGGASGESNLYSFDASTDPPTLKFIATLESGSPIGRLPDALNWSPRAFESYFVLPESYVRSSRVSRDGRTLIFSSNRPLTGYDNKAINGSECRPENVQCGELFRYFTASNGERSLSCISCDRDGSSPLGAAHFQSAFLNATGALPEGNPLLNIPANISGNGDRVFFETPDPLLPADTNGDGGCPTLVERDRAIPTCQDVYEWEVAGAEEGSCTVAEVAGGCLYLLSTGKSESPSFFAGASTDGRVAFIVTSSALVPSDTDNASDAYAVRIGGGLAAQFPESVARPCSGEDCLNSPSGPPGSSEPGSAVVAGPQNSTDKRIKHRSKRHKNHRKHRRATKSRSEKAKHRHKAHQRNAVPHSAGKAS